MNEENFAGCVCIGLLFMVSYNFLSIKASISNSLIFVLSCIGISYLTSKLQQGIGERKGNIK